MNGAVVPLRPHDPATVTGLRSQDGIAIIALGGRLDPDCLTVCRAALGRALARRPHAVVLDLSGITGGQAAAGVLGLMRNHAARHGAQLWLACPPAPLMAALHHAGADRTFRLLPTPQALADALTHRPTRKDHRSANAASHALR